MAAADENKSFSIIAFFSNILFTLICLFVIRIYIVYLRIHNPKKTIAVNKSPTTKFMIVLGSGGHTFEMICLIQNISEKYRPRIYVVADTDKMSEEKVIAFESSKNINSTIKIKDESFSAPYTIEKIPRSREVHQSWISTVFTTVLSSLYSLLIVFRHMPEAILCNGPGTCVPICLVSFLFHVLGIKRMTVIYVESICRVKTMSLSGKILYYIVNYFLVQWPQLKEKYPRVKYIGRLI